MPRGGPASEGVMATMPAEPELLSLVLALRPAGPHAGPAVPWWGRASQALLLNTVEWSQPSLARLLHEGSGPRPFTASSLLGHFSGGRTDPGQVYTLRFTALQADVAAALLAGCGLGGLLAPGAEVNLAGQLFQVVSVTSDPAEHPWAATEDYAGLAASRLAAGAAVERQISLVFTSPTSFRTQGRTMPLPLPELVFGSLLERWNAFAPLALPEEVRRFAQECLAVSRFDLATRPVPGKDGGLRVGAVGRITYAALNTDRYWLSLLQTLAAFALFSGVGAGTAAGLGQCRFAPRDEE